MKYLNGYDTEVSSKKLFGIDDPFNEEDSVLDYSDNVGMKYIRKMLVNKYGITGNTNKLLAERYEDAVFETEMKKGTFFSDLDKQVEYVKNIYALYGFSEEEALKSINNKVILSTSFVELDRRSAVLNCFGLLEYSYFEDPTLLITEGLSERLLYSLLTELKDKGLSPEELIREIIRLLNSTSMASDSELEKCFQQNKYTPKEKLVNLYELHRKLYHNETKLVYKK